jgi:hypothetical protein
MKRNFRVMQLLYNPDFILFAGDFMDGGREWGNEQY